MCLRTLKGHPDREHATAFKSCNLLEEICTCIIVRGRYIRQRQNDNVICCARQAAIAAVSDILYQHAQMGFSLRVNVMQACRALLMYGQSLFLVFARCNNCALELKGSLQKLGITNLMEV